MYYFPICVRLAEVYCTFWNILSHFGGVVSIIIGKVFATEELHPLVQ